MRRHAAAVLLLGLAPVAGHAAAVETDDDRGARVALAAPALHIVSLAPSLTEAAFAAGAGARLVGVVRYSDYPAQARTIVLTDEDCEKMAFISADTPKLSWAGLEIETGTITSSILDF